MNARKALVEATREEFISRTVKNPHYSLRAFARDLKISPATVSGLLSGKREVSVSTAKNILREISLAEDQARFILSSWGDPEFEDLDSVVSKAGLERRIFELFSVLAFMETSGFDGSVGSVAKAFSMSGDEAHGLMDLLTRLQLVGSNDGKFQVTGRKFSVGDKGVQPNLAFTSKDSLSFVERFLDEADDEYRFAMSDLSLMFIPSSAQKLGEAKKRIKTFRRKIAKFLDTGERSTPFLLAINLVPLSDWKCKKLKRRSGPLKKP